MAAVHIPELQTERLLLRGPTDADALVWAKFLDEDPDFLQYIPRRPGVPSGERAERLVRTYTGRWESPLGMGWSIVEKESAEMIGFAGVDAIDETDGEIDYFIARAYWRRGYGSEVARAITDYWFRRTSGERLVAYVIPENVGSVRAVTKLGYERRGSVNYLDLMGNPPGIVFETPLADELCLSRDAWERGSG